MLIVQSEGEILKLIIRKAGLTQNDFADKLGVSRVTISNLTTKHKLSEDWKLKICSVLNVSKDVFAGKNYEESAEHVNHVAESTLLNADERKALWDIINAQKAIIQRLEQSIQENESDK